MNKNSYPKHCDGAYFQELGRIIYEIAREHFGLGGNWTEVEIGSMISEKLGYARCVSDLMEIVKIDIGKINLKVNKK